MATETAKKHIKEVTAEYLPFWEPLFDNMGLAKPMFYAKLGYNGGEFGTPKVECVRFWPSELDSGQDCYVELFDWNQNYYNKSNRTLYRLKADTNWEKTGKFAKVESSSLSTPTYALKISDLEVVNTTPSTHRTAEIYKVVSSAPEVMTGIVEMESATAAFDPYLTETDAHMSNMTLKDHYCITHSVPMSDKPWLNQLILNSRAWLEKQNQK
jgi:hypothetical protein